MIEPWFSRSFVPVDVHRLPGIVERLRGTPARLEERLCGLPTSVLTARAGDTWSIQENVGHLLDLEVLWKGRFDDLFGGEDLLRGADLENRGTHEANHNADDLAAVLDRFREQRRDWLARIGASMEECGALTAEHPRLHQPMTLTDLAHFIAEHDDHHLARISELLRSD